MLLDLNPVRKGRDVNARSFAGLMELYEQNYLRLRNLAPDLKVADEMISSVPGHQDLYLSITQRCPYTTMLRLTYRFEDEGSRGFGGIYCREKGSRARRVYLGGHACRRRKSRLDDQRQKQFNVTRRRIGCSAFKPDLINLHFLLNQGVEPMAGRRRTMPGKIRFMLRSRLKSGNQTRAAFTRS